MTPTRSYARIPFVAAISALLLSGCASAPRYQKTAPSGTSTTVVDEAVSVKGQDVVKRAESFLGAPYRYGGTSPKGVDCSGLVYSVYGEIGIALPRTSSDQASFGAEVEKAELQVGDLVFFRTNGTDVSHVGIYAGNGEFIHASTRAKRVKFDRLDNKYFRKRYVSARRVL